MPDVKEPMAAVGERLRAHRRQQGRTLLDVATQSGVTKGFLSLAERGQTNVSVPTLLRLCAALRVPIASLFDFPHGALVKRGQSPFAMGGKGVHEELLTSRSVTDVQVMRTVLEPDGGSDGAYALEATTIVVHVIRGALSLQVAGEQHDLDTGDTLSFSARSKHSWSNGSATESEVLWVISPALPTTPSS